MSLGLECITFKAKFRWFGWLAFPYHLQPSQGARCLQSSKEGLPHGVRLPSDNLMKTLESSPQESSSHSHTILLTISGGHRLRREHFLLKATVWPLSILEQKELCGTCHQRRNLGAIIEFLQTPPLWALPFHQPGQRLTQKWASNHPLHSSSSITLLIKASFICTT